MSSHHYFINALNNKICSIKKTNEKTNDKSHLLKNSGCCGAVSDAWIPSYPSSESSSLKVDEESLSSINKDDK